MKTLSCLLVLIVVQNPGTVPVNAAEPKTPQTATPKITVSKATTFVTGPLNKDGSVDFAAALNRIHSRGVTAKNNANVLIWQAFGPHPENAKMPPKFFKLMGMKQPPEKGDYLIDLSDFVKQRFGKTLTDKKREAIFDEQGEAMQRPWSATQFPIIVAWVKANEKPLKIVIAATKRTKYFSPLVVVIDVKESYGLMGAIIPAVQQSRSVARLLAARAMLRVKAGQSEAAWRDLLACQRLGRLIGRGPTLIDGMVGIAICHIAGRSTVSLLQHSQLTTQQIKRFQQNLQELAPLPDMAEKVNFGERLMGLDATVRIAQLGLKHLWGFPGGSMKVPPRLFFRVNDWNVVVKTVNRWYDRLNIALKKPTRANRNKALDLLDKEIKKLSKETKKRFAQKKGLKSSKAVSQKMGHVLILLLLPAVAIAQNAEDRAEQRDRNLQVAFALAAFQKDRGRYPKQLDELAPKYLTRVPQDLFAGKPLKYRLIKNGYLLYSVGQNEKDDGGKTYGDRKQADDLRIQIPRPVQPK